MTITKILSGGGKRPMRLLGDVDLVMVTGTITFASTDSGTGVSFAPSDVGLAEIYFANFTPALCGTQSAVLAYDVSNKYVKAYVVPPTGASTNASANLISAGATLDAFSSRFLVVGYV
jgi:hypothetical protein